MKMDWVGWFEPTTTARQHVLFFSSSQFCLSISSSNPARSIIWVILSVSHGWSKNWNPDLLITCIIFYCVFLRNLRPFLVILNVWASSSKLSKLFSDRMVQNSFSSGWLSSTLYIVVVIRLFALLDSIITSRINRIMLIASRFFMRLDAISIQY